MLRSAEPFSLAFFVTAKVAVQEPADEPAVTVQVSPVAGVTVAMPEAPPQLSLSASVPFFARTTTASGPGLEALNVMVQALPLRCHDRHSDSFC